MDGTEDMDDNPEPPALSTPREAEGAGVDPLRRSDVKLYERAVKERWVIPDAALTEVPLKLLETLRASTNPKTTVAVARAFDAIVRTNHGSTEAGSDGPKINLVLHQGGEPPDAPGGEGQVVIPHNERTHRNADRS